MISMPEIMVQVGLTGSNPVQLSTSFRLGDATFGQLDGPGTLGTSTTWSDISDDVRSFEISIPSTREQGPLWVYQGATITITLDNSRGDYDPANVGGPFFGQLSPMVPVRVLVNFSGVSYPLYSGFADGWFPADITQPSEYAEMVLSATDAFKVLAGITLTAVAITGTGVDTGTRVRDILTRAGWYNTAERLKIDTGNSTLQGTTLGDTALSLMQLAVDSELGQLYSDGEGAIVFRSRHAVLTDTRSNTVQGVFGDAPGTSHTAGTELYYASISRANDDTRITNDVQATINGGTLQEVTDTASVAKYLFPRVYQRSDLILQSDSDALAWAQWVLYVSKDEENRIDSITVDPAADPVNLWPHVLGRIVGDRIQIWHRPPGVSTPISQDCFVVGIQHDWNPTDNHWITQWFLADASKYGSFLTLDNPTLGKLGSNALAF